MYTGLEASEMSILLADFLTKNVGGRGFIWELRRFCRHKTSIEIRKGKKIDYPSWKDMFKDFYDGDIIAAKIERLLSLPNFMYQMMDEDVFNSMDNTNRGKRIVDRLKSERVKFVNSNKD